MKKLFGQTKRPVQPWNYDENEFDWEDAEEAAGAEFADREDIGGAVYTDAYDGNDTYGGQEYADEGKVYFEAGEDREEEPEDYEDYEDAGEALEDYEEPEAYEDEYGIEEESEDYEDLEDAGEALEDYEEPEAYEDEYGIEEEPEDYEDLEDAGEAMEEYEEPETYEDEYGIEEEPEDYEDLEDAGEALEEYEALEEEEESEEYESLQDIEENPDDYEDSEEYGDEGGIAAYEVEDEGDYTLNPNAGEYAVEDADYFDETGYAEEDEGYFDDETAYAVLDEAEDTVALGAENVGYASAMGAAEEAASYGGEDMFSDLDAAEEAASYGGEDMFSDLDAAEEAASYGGEDMFSDLGAAEEAASYGGEDMFSDLGAAEEAASYDEEDMASALDGPEDDTAYDEEDAVYAEGLEYAGYNDDYVGETDGYTQVPGYAACYDGYAPDGEDYAECYDGYGADGGDYADSYDGYDEGGGDYAGTEEYAGEETGRYDTQEYGEEEGDGYGETDSFGPSGVNTGRRGLPARIGELFRGMDTMDRIMAAVGVGVLVLAVVTGGVFVSSLAMRSQMASFADVGTQLEGITMIGEKGLMAVADAEVARIMAAAAPEEDVEEPEPESEPPKEYDEKEYGRQVAVNPDFTSIQKDLKIKFINQKTDKLVANVPFSVMVTGPDGKTFIWSDDDMDGIIYKKDIAAGSYQVVMEALDENKYSDYIVSADVRSVQVKEEIVYEKVDVENEVKQETEINVSVEDTKVNEVVVESTLQDTVQWVESKVLDVTYSEVAKSTIADPATLALGKVFWRMSANSAPSSGSSSGSLTEGASSEASESSAESGPSESMESSESMEASVESGSSESADPSGESEPSESADPSGESEPSESADPSGENGSSESTAPSGESNPSESADPSVESNPSESTEPSGESESPDPAAGKVTVDNAELTGAAGAELKAKATVSGFAEGGEISYQISSDNTAVATAAIDSDGNVTITGVAAGTAVLTITAECRYKPEGAADVEIIQAAASIHVTIADKLALTLDKTSATAYTDEQIVINAALVNSQAAEPAFTAESSDTNIATVKVEKNAVTITGAAAGSAVITVKYTEDGQEVKATCAVTVKSHPKNDKTTKLTDLSGNQLYVTENDTYREAVYADYYTADKFYIKGEVKYSGWQTIDGRVYYFDSDGNKVTGEQIIQGAKYNFTADGSLALGDGATGIDVSKWNGTIDWNAVKNSGVSYVIIRCGYRGSSEGKLIQDSKFESNIKGATAAGLKVGVYFFSQAVDEVEAVEEASMVLAQIKNYTISYPVFLDVETSGGRGDKIDKATRTAVCKAFCQTIQNANYTAGVYSNKTWLETKLNVKELGEYKIWLAQYAATPTYAGRYDIWQYRSTGSISGISGDVDMNISYLGY